MTDRKIANSLFSRVASSLGVDGMTCAPPDAKRSFTADESRALTTSALSFIDDRLRRSLWREQCRPI